MSATTGHERDLGAEPRAFMGLANRLGPLLLAALVAVAFPSAGLAASLAVAVGGLLAGLAFATLARGLEALLASRARASGGRLWALGALVPRQGLLALSLFVAVVVLELPAIWLLAGVTAWPVALATAAVLVSCLPERAALAGASQES